MGDGDDLQCVSAYRITTEVENIYFCQSRSRSGAKMVMEILLYQEVPQSFVKSTSVLNF